MFCCVAFGEVIFRRGLITMPQCQSKAFISNESRRLNMAEPGSTDVANTL
jgi:hypothetical protein